MKFINTKEDMMKQVEEHNNRENCLYKIMVDYEYKKDLFKAFEGVPGILGLPYTVSGKGVVLYFINQDYLIDMWKHQNEQIEDRPGKFTSRELKILMKRRLSYYNLLFGKEYIINDLIVFKEKGMISDNIMEGKLNHNDDLLNKLSKVGLSNIIVSSKYLVVGEATYNIDEWVKPLTEFRVAFRGGDKMLVSSEDEIITFMNKEYTNLEMYAKQIIVRKDMHDTEDLVIAFKQTLIELIKTSTTVKEFGIRHQADSLINFLLNNEFPKDYILNSDILTVISFNLPKLGITNIHNKSLKYILRTFSNYFYNGIYKHTEEIKDSNTLNLYCKKYNEIKPHKLVVDYRLSSAKYELSKQFETALSYIMYLEQDNRFVVVYQFNTEFDRRQFLAMTKDSQHNSKCSRLAKSTMNEIARDSFLHYNSLVFDAQMVKTLYYLYRLETVKSDEFITNATDIKIKNIRDLFRIVKLEDVAFKDNSVYVRLKGSYKLKPLDTIVKRINGEYFTVIKFVSSDAFVVSRIVEDLREFDCKHKGNDLNDNCKMLYNRLKIQIQPSKRPQKRWLKDIETYDHFYKICKDCTANNDFVELYSKVFRSRCCK